MDEPAPDVEVTVTAHDAESAEIAVVGELTEHARRPLVREMTDLMLAGPTLKQIRLDLCEVTFMNSAGLATLVQVQRMAQPRGIDTTLVVHSAVVARPLQLSGLWRRFTIVDRREGHPEDVHEATPHGHDHS
ncbi:STAS domain-containing protein [Modestobacter marinus]|nr:STAS domain-containing protein [Modestobacter marinus]NIH66688.1 anti-anti-sigma factor [Modestobacter marinus]